MRPNCFSLRLLQPLPQGPHLTSDIGVKPMLPVAIVRCGCWCRNCSIHSGLVAKPRWWREVCSVRPGFKANPCGHQDCESVLVC